MPLPPLLRETTRTTHLQPTCRPQTGITRTYAAERTQGSYTSTTTSENHSAGSGGISGSMDSHNTSSTATPTTLSALEQLVCLYQLFAIPLTLGRRVSLPNATKASRKMLFCFCHHLMCQSWEIMWTEDRIKRYVFGQTCYRDHRISPN